LFRLLEHRLVRRSAPDVLPRAIRAQSGEMTLLNSETELSDLEEVLREISEDVMAAWNGPF
jgi:hypothetical protein